MAGSDEARDARRDPALSGRNPALRDRDAALRDRDAALSDRDAALSGRDPALGRRACAGAEDAGVPECTACGACCFSSLPEYVRVFGCDYDRMDDRARELTVFLGNRCYMKIEDGRCAALVIDAVAGRFLCSIYEVRPDCCRALDRGSGACRGELHTKRERSLLALDALRRGAAARDGRA